MRTRGRGRISAQRAANGKRSRSRERFRHPLVLVLAIVESWKKLLRKKANRELNFSERVPNHFFVHSPGHFRKRSFRIGTKRGFVTQAKRRTPGCLPAWQLSRVSSAYFPRPGNQSTSTSFRVPPCSLNAAPPSYPRPAPWCPRPGPALAGPEPALSPRACPRATPNASISSPSEIPTVCRQIFRAGASA